jgi:hypothetical protein
MLRFESLDRAIGRLTFCRRRNFTLVLDPGFLSLTLPERRDCRRFLEAIAHLSLSRFAWVFVPRSRKFPKERFQS